MREKARGCHSTVLRKAMAAESFNTLSRQKYAERPRCNERRDKQ
jgi:hypothetical protein